MAVDLPPLRYDHPFVGTLVIERVDLEGLWKHCQPYGGWACEVTINGTAHIYIVRETEIVEGPSRDRFLRELPLLIRHEIGHANGWPADHPK